MTENNEKLFDNSERYRDLGYAISYYRKRKGLTNVGRVAAAEIRKFLLAEAARGSVIPYSLPNGLCNLTHSIYTSFMRYL